MAEYAALRTDSPLRQGLGYSVGMILALYSTLLAIVVVGLTFHNSERAAAPGLIVVNQAEHTVLLIDLATKRVRSSFEVGVAGHEVAVSPDGGFAYSPIYGNSGVGKPGTDGRSIAMIDLQKSELVGEIDLGKPVRPHCAAFGPDGLLYVSAELSNELLAVDTRLRKVVAEIPTGQAQSHMFVLSPGGERAYVANVGPGSISVVDLHSHSLLKIIPVAKTLQRISISRDGRFIYTHDQTAPRIAVIDTRTLEIASLITPPQIVYSSAVSHDGHWLLANSLQGELFVWDVSSMKLAQTLEIPPSFGEIVISSDDSKAYVSCPSAGTVEVISLKDWKKEAPIVLSKGVDGMALYSAARSITD